MPAKPRRGEAGARPDIQSGREVVSNFYIIQHPLIEHKLLYLRDKTTRIKEFNRLLKEIAMLMAYEVTKDFPSEPKEVETPFDKKVQGRVIRGKKAVLVPILRAGLVMAEGIKEVTASSRMGHIGLHRDRSTNRIVEYMVQLPPAEGRTFILVDPMMATGESACRAIDILHENGSAAADIRFVSLIVSPQAMALVTQRHPGVRVYAAALDPGLNEDNRITPGLGFIGKRLFGTL